VFGGCSCCFGSALLTRSCGQIPSAIA
jgi:hypothetical protein